MKNTKNETSKKGIFYSDHGQKALSLSGSFCVWALALIAAVAFTILPSHTAFSAPNNEKAEKDNPGKKLGLSKENPSVLVSKSKPKPKKKDETATEERTIGKKMTGEVDLVRDDLIILIYNRDSQTGREYEVDFTPDEFMSLSRLNNLDDLKRGDIIEITYEEVVSDVEKINTEGEKKSYQRIMSRKPTDVRFIRSADSSRVLTT